MAVKLIYSNGQPVDSPYRMKMEKWTIDHVLQGLPLACQSPEAICTDYSNMGYDGCWNCPHHRSVE